MGGSIIALIEELALIMGAINNEKPDRKEIKDDLDKVIRGLATIRDAYRKG